jgi:hypothetical protein
MEELRGAIQFSRSDAGSRYEFGKMELESGDAAVAIAT